ncbi:ArsR/SmtB family transcription factor [Ornithinimicrobium panacihumi]|uniref:ArsR/SmtB family transcription factor n=1 Tax=Ornithinimicrobium panacihumi TaxID=2008449 RepID=UPI003F89BB0D
MVKVLERCTTAEGAGPGLGEAEATRLAAVFKALGDPVRLRMASMIAAAPELCVCEITPAFDLSSATVSHHLKTLREAGLVDCERRGTFVYYWIPPQAQNILATLLTTESHHP